MKIPLQCISLVCWRPINMTSLSNLQGIYDCRCICRTNCLVRKVFKFWSVKDFLFSCALVNILIGNPGIFYFLLFCHCVCLYKTLWKQNVCHFKSKLRLAFSKIVMNGLINNLWFSHHLRWLISNLSWSDSPKLLKCFFYFCLDSFVKQWKISSH